MSSSAQRRTPVWIWLVVAIALGLLWLRTAVATLSVVSSDSMIPALLPGDRLIVDRRAARRLPRRGDVVVFRYPGEPGRVYVKRVIGLPGETITYHADRLAIDGRPATYLPQPDYRFRSGEGPFGTSEANAFIEGFAGSGHRILERPEPLHAPGSVWHVPSGHVFLLGDNRDASNDSRFLGAVATDDIEGRAYRVLWSRDEAVGRIRWSRTWQAVD